MSVEDHHRPVNDPNDRLEPFRHAGNVADSQVLSCQAVQIGAPAIRPRRRQGFGARHQLIQQRQQVARKLHLEYLQLRVPDRLDR